MSYSYSHLPEIQEEVIETVFETMIEKGAEPHLVDNIRKHLIQVFDYTNNKAQEAIDARSRLEREQQALLRKHIELEIEKTALHEKQEKLHVAASKVLALPGQVDTAVSSLATKVDMSLSNLVTKSDLQEWMNVVVQKQSEAIRSAVSESVEAQQQPIASGQLRTMELLGQAAKRDAGVAANLSQTVLSLEAKLGQQGSQLEEMRKQLEDSKGQVQSREVVIADREEAIDALQQDLDDKGSRLEAQYNIAFDQQQTIDQLRQEATLKENELAKTRSRLRELDSHPEQSMISQMYDSLARKYQDIPTVSGGSDTFDLRDMAISAAPLLLDPSAKQKVAGFLEAGLGKWHCLKAITTFGERALPTPDKRCQLHGGNCILVRVVDDFGDSILDFCYAKVGGR